MKISPMAYLGLTTMILLTVVIFATMDLSFGWVFYTMCLGQVLLVISVYKILRDDYSTEKTFSDFYEDRPDLGT